MSTMNQPGSLSGLIPEHAMPPNISFGVLGRLPRQWWLWLGGIAVIALATVAVADWLPTESDAAGPQVPTSLAGGDKRSGSMCPECGFVEATREIEPDGEVNGAGTAPVSKPLRRYEVTVRMTDGSSQVFVDASPMRWRAGERLIVIGGASQSNN